MFCLRKSIWNPFHTMWHLSSSQPRVGCRFDLACGEPSPPNLGKGSFSFPPTRITTPDAQTRAPGTDRGSFFSLCWFLCLSFPGCAQGGMKFIKANELQEGRIPADPGHLSLCLGRFKERQKLEVSGSNAEGRAPAAGSRPLSHSHGKPGGSLRGASCWRPGKPLILKGNLTAGLLNLHVRFPFLSLPASSTFLYLFQKIVMFCF